MKAEDQYEGDERKDRGHGQYGHYDDGVGLFENIEKNRLSELTKKTVISVMHSDVVR